jgi:V/A-type H+-transporting ATPase subunit E
MSLDRLKQEVLSQAERQAKEMLDEAKREEQKILDEARAKAKAVVSGNEELGKTQAKELALELRASALLQAKRLESDAKEEVVQSVLAEVKEELKRITGSPKYEKIFDSLAREAIKALGEKDFLLKCSARDRKLASKYGRVGDAIATIGGVIAAKADGSIQINNTFEALLEENEEKLKQKAFEELFGRETRKTPSPASSKPVGTAGKARIKKRKK